MQEIPKEIKRNIDKDEEQCVQGYERCRMPTRHAHLFRQIVYQHKGMPNDIPTIESKKAADIHADTGKSHYNHNKRPPGITPPFTLGHLVHQIKRDDAQKQSRKHKPNDHNHIEPYHWVVTVKPEVLKISEEVWRVGKEQKPNQANDREDDAKRLA